MSHVTSNTYTGGVRMSLSGTCHILKESCLYIEGVMQCTSEMKKSCHTLKQSCDAGHVDGSAGCIGEYCVNY